MKSPEWRGMAISLIWLPCNGAPADARRTARHANGGPGSGVTAAGCAARNGRRPQAARGRRRPDGARPAAGARPPPADSRRWWWPGRRRPAASPGRPGPTCWSSRRRRTRSPPCAWRGSRVAEDFLWLGQRRRSPIPSRSASCWPATSRSAPTARSSTAGRDPPPGQAAAGRAGAARDPDAPGRLPLQPAQLRHPDAPPPASPTSTSIRAASTGSGRSIAASASPSGSTRRRCSRSTPPRTWRAARRYYS